MSLFIRNFFLILALARLSLLAQPAEPNVEKPAAAAEPAKIEAAEPPPEEPLEQPVKKPRRRMTRPDLRPHHPSTIFGENIVVKEGETIDELVLLGGSADIQGTVDGDVVIIGGTARISGAVRGEFVLVGGSLE